MFNIKKYEAIALGVAFIISPALVSAASTADLQSHIDALLSQVKVLQQQLRQMHATSTVEHMPCATTQTPCQEREHKTPPPCEGDSCPPKDNGAKPMPPMAAMRACPSLTRALSRGISGDDVKQLQNFLAEQGVLAKNSNSGFFGALTEAALKQWQSNEGITTDATSSAMVGERVRALILQRCGGTPMPSKPEKDMRPSSASTTPSGQNMPVGSCKWFGKVYADGESIQMPPPGHGDNEAAHRPSFVCKAGSIVLVPPTTTLTPGAGEQSSAERNAQYAAALTAMESILRSIISKLNSQ